jgi:hypothetical protein
MRSAGLLGPKKKTANVIIDVSTTTRNAEMRRLTM